MSGALATPPPGADLRIQTTGTVRIQRLAERGIVGLLFVAASVASVATIAIFWTMAKGGWDFFGEVSAREFFLGTIWSPEYTGDYGSVPLVKGTLLIAVGACLLGVPLGIGTALYLSEFASQRVRSVAKPAIEVLAGVPSIVFGLLAIFTLGPWIMRTFGTEDLLSALSAILALSVMVVPIVATVAEDAIRAVPRELRDGSLALGATRWETAWSVTLPSARSGLTAGVLLGFSRAIGDTMVVALAAGALPWLGVDLLKPHATMTQTIANRAGGDLPFGSVAYNSMFALALYLFLLTLALNLAAQFVLARHRRRFG